MFHFIDPKYYGDYPHDAIEAAGGTTAEADLKRVNLAERVRDEGHYHVPRMGETEPAPVLGPEDTGKLDTYIATCQVGITISSLALGFYGQAQVAGMVAPILASAGIVSELAAQSVSATLVLIVLSIFQVLLGELVEWRARYSLIF
ncbi:MAG: hypothetical protein IIC78_15205 [Chloroflexi bacterium]|nr:hypothetical protein [Chloroflexota bacterium]